MPGIDGWETIRRLRADGPGDIPVAIVSANAFDRGLDDIVNHQRVTGLEQVFGHRPAHDAQPDKSDRWQ